MSTQWVFITPQDVWMFRDSRAFSAGDSFFARSIFPPHPGTAQGMIRTFYYERTRTIIGSASDLGGLRLAGPFVARASGSKLEHLVPLPLDLVPGAQPVRLAPGERTFYTDLDAGWLPLVPVERREIAKADSDEYWLNEAHFAAYLSGSGALNAIPGEELYTFDERTGLGMDHRRRAHEEGRFYRAAFVRPSENVGLLVGVDYVQPVFTDTAGTLTVGGESRIGNYQTVDYTMRLSAVAGRVKVVLLTPAYFREGWLPAGGEWARWMGKSARLISAAIGRPLAFSGWDMANKKPKPLRHFVPAGSVYYFEDAEPTGLPFTESVDGEADYAAVGYGGFALAAWQYA